MAQTSPEIRIRPMRPEDVAAAEDITAVSFLEVDRRAWPAVWGAPERRGEAAADAWRRRAAHLIGTDPAGCWVGEVDGRTVGVVTSFNRELTWFLSSFAVSPNSRRSGIGTALLAAALEHGRGCLRGMFNAGSDPTAAGLYRRAGFDLHPFMNLRGRVDRTTLPVVEHVRAGNPADRELADSVDRRTRGAAHLDLHHLLAEQFEFLVVDRPTGQGYAYVDATGSPVLLAATTRTTAAELLWAALAASTPGQAIVIPHISAANQWALDVGLAAGLAIEQSGYQALRHLRPPRPYLPHGSLL